MKRSFIFILLSLLLPACSGSVTFNITNYPDFYSEKSDYDSIAVTPITNRLEADTFTGLIGESIVSGVRRNGAYAVADYTNRHDDERVLLQEIGQSSDLVLFATIHDYGVETREDIEVTREERKVYATNREGLRLLDDYGDPIVLGTEYVEVPYSIFRTHSYAKISTRVLATANQATLYQNTLEGSCSEEAGNPNNLSSNFSMLKCALTDAADFVVYEIVPTWEKVTVEEDTLLRLQSQATQKDAKKFTKEDQGIVITTWLPNKARMNDFAIDLVTNENSPRQIDRQDFIWDQQTLRFTYSIDQLLQAANFGKFMVRFWSDGVVVFTREFEIK